MTQSFAFGVRKSRVKLQPLCRRFRNVHRLSEPKPNYQFGPYVVDARACELRKHGYRIKLQERPFQLLLALVERPGELITREELRQRLWPDGTFVDFDHNISSAVNKLRAALNDSARHPHYIETAGRRGYRFLYPVTPVKPPSVSKIPVPPESSLKARRQIVTVALLGLLFIGFGVLFLVRRYLAPNKGQIRSIAVLPLKNLSSDPEQEYFSEGLTDELITRLASLQGLRVISSTSTMQYKNSNKPLLIIAKELNVDAVVEGSILRGGGRVRITAQLIEASTDRHIWAESYDRDQRDILTLQNEVTREIAEKIKLNLDPVARGRLSVAHQVDPIAHEEYLRGRHAWSKRTAAGFREAISHFEAAIAHDPAYARAYAGLADCYGLMSGYTLEPQSEYIPKARAAALKALELDPNLAEAHTSLALIAQNYDWDWQTAEREYRRAIELDPNYATAHHWFGECLAFLGRFQEAESEMERARQLDPLSLIIEADHGAILYYARQYDRAIEQFRAVQARDPYFPRAHMIEMAYVQKSMFKEALADAVVNEKTGYSPWTSGVLAIIYGRAGRSADAHREIEKVKRLRRQRNIDPAPLVYAAVGMEDKDAAFSALEQAYLWHSTVLSNLKVDPLYDPLRGDPRFQDLMHRIGLTQ
jgi:TolB-like protein/DNA-binding winged helix-turn-helix (wHTH) protein/Tfp pilus assembly protein PilF